MQQIEDLLNKITTDTLSLVEISKKTGIEYGVLDRFKKGSEIKAKDFLKLRAYYYPDSVNGLSKTELSQVPEGNYMEVDFLPIYAQAGYLNACENSSNVVAEDDPLPTILVPKEYEKGKYLVIETGL